MQHTAANSQTSTPLSQNAHQTATSQEPGFGVEFEAACIEIQSQYTGITSEQTNKVKGEVLDNRQGNLWRLTGDDTPDIPGRLTAQYILDGLQIKLGRGTAAQAAEHVAVDLRSWHPFSGQPRLVMVDSMKKEEIAQLNPFYIRPITPSPNLDTILWSRQVTAPMPLGALNKLFEAAQRGKQSVLLPVGRELRERLVWMRPEFFQSEPEGISSQDLTEDQLWFLGLVVSYAKASSCQETDKGPKYVLPVMSARDPAKGTDAQCGAGMTGPSAILWMS